MHFGKRIRNQSFCLAVLNNKEVSTSAALSATAIFFSFLNLARDSAEALYNFPVAVMVTDVMN